MRPKNKVTKTCEHCGKEFEAAAYLVKKGQGRYCSQSCYMAEKWNATGACKNCGKPAKTTYCSDECRVEFWNKTDYHNRKKQIYWNKKVELIKSLGGKCVRCGNDDIRVLDLNHIDRSRKHVPEKRHYTWFHRFKDWNKNKDNLEILCANCHRLHTWEQMGYGVDSGNDN